MKRNIKKMALAAMLAGMLGSLTGCFIQPDPTLVNSIAHVQQAALRIPMRFGIGIAGVYSALLGQCQQA